MQNRAVGPRNIAASSAKLRALSVRQPAAWAIIHAGKDIENRSWKNKHTHGTIAIHASNGLAPPITGMRGVKCPPKENLVRSAIIGVVDIVAVVDHHRSRWYKDGYGWVLKNPRPLRKPIPCTGRLWLWPVSRKIEREIERQMGVGYRKTN